MDVTDFGAKGDGRADNTAAFQAALDRAGKVGDIVTIPAGQYRLDGTLIVPEGVTLEGVWRGPHTSQVDKGSTLLAYAGREQEEGPPFISLATGSTLKGITIFYPEQKVEDIKPYPWTIQGCGQHYNIIDVTIANAYNGVDCGSRWNCGHHLRNVHMCCLRRGLLIDQCTDIGRVENVHIHNVYWWTIPERLDRTQIESLRQYTLANLEGFIIGRTDWEYISNCFVIWPKVGFRFISTNTPAGGQCNAVITQSGSDDGPLAVKVEAVQFHAGVAFENCQFMAGFRIDETNTGPLKLSNCGFWGRPEGGSQMVLNGSGTVALTGCHFSDWDSAKPCVQAHNGSLLMNGCDFLMGDPDAPRTAHVLAMSDTENPPTAHVLLSGKVKSAAIVGTRFRSGKARIINESTAQLQAIGNLER